MVLQTAGKHREFAEPEAASQSFAIRNIPNSKRLRISFGRIVVTDTSMKPG
jgi:hypothetical protein